MTTDVGRFEAKVSRVPIAGCWLWIGCVTKGGYSKFFYRGSLGHGHRFAWETWRGPIPTGLVLDHKCRVRCCVNPSHLRVVTSAENTLENSFSASAVHAAKTTCGRCGGPYTTRLDRMARTCRRCNAAKCHAYRVAHLEQMRAADRARRRRS